MVVILKKNPAPEQVQNLIARLEEKKIEVRVMEGSSHTVLGLLGDTSQIDMELISAMDVVEDVYRVQEPYKNATRMIRTEDTVIHVGNATIGGGELTLIAGPCSVESEEQICEIAKSVKKSGAKILRGGAFKPRTSPYSFQGMGEEGMRLLLLAKKETGLPIVTEITTISQLPLFEDVDIIQVGARNMQNFELLKELGKVDKPVLLKRGLASTYQELLMSAEYIMAGGNQRVILCERGIRTFETHTRNTMDIAAVPVLKRLSHLPVIADPSHSTGKASLVDPLSCAAVAAGADGVMIEVHNDPAHALCDGPQSIHPEAFAKLAKKLTGLHSVMAEMND